MTILITAAFGNQGRQLVPKLAAQGANVRALRGRGAADELIAMGAAETVVGDAMDPAILRQAMEGIDTVYYIGPSLHPAETVLGMAAIDYAKAAGVKNFVYSSVMHSNIYSLPHHEAKARIEEYLLNSGLRYTVLKPSSYMKLKIYLKEAQAGRARRFWSMDRFEAMVDVNDITDVATRVLLEPEAHGGATYELVGDYLDGHQIAEVIGKVTGRDVKPEEFAPEEFLRAAFKGDPADPEFAYQIRAIRAMNAWYGANDFQGSSHVLRMLLGREPATLEDALKREMTQG